MTRQSDDAVKPGVVAWVALAAGAVLAVWAFAFASQQVFNPDPCVYGEAAQQLLDGGTLYADVWEDKPPLALLAYAVPQVIAPGSMAGLQVFLALALIGAGVLAAQEAVSREGQLLIVGIMVLLPLTHIDLVWLSTEHISNLFVLVVLWCIIKEHRDGEPGYRLAIIAGVAVACTFHVRQTAVVIGFLYAALLLASPAPLSGRVRRLTVFVCSGLATWLVFILAIALFADLEGYVNTVLLYPMQYAGVGSWQAAIKLLVESTQTPLPFVAALLIAAGWRSGHRRLSLATLATGVVMVVLPRRTAIHYLASLIPFLVLLVWIADEKRPQARQSLGVITAGVIATAALMAATTLWHVADAPSARWMDGVVERVAELEGEEATIWVVGPKVSTYIHFRAANPPANSFWVAFRLDPPYVDTLPRPRPEVMTEYLDRPPEVLVVYAELLEKKYAAGARPKAPEAIQNSSELLDNLLLGKRYVHREVISNFAILTLR